jgi:UPF0755 protein
LLLLGAAAAWTAWAQYQRFLQTPLDLPREGYLFILAPGSHGADIVAELSAMGFTQSGWEWRLLMRLEPQVYRAGEYRLDHGLKPRELLEKFASGWVSELGVDEPEGWFLPETYLFVLGDSDLDILARAHRAMQEALALAWASRDEGLPLETPYELLILASIIEKETGVKEERAEIAGVFTRRLHKGMRLQTDPTVIYGLGASFDGDLRRRDLESDTPYNTYTRHGLPPTPIAMPGRASVLAAAHPAPGDALFFVANGNGGHTFSATLEEHRAAVNELLGRE